jgi:hypothetical protein
MGRRRFSSAWLVVIVCVGAALGGCSDSSDGDSEVRGNEPTSTSTDRRVEGDATECAEVVRATNAVPGEAVVDGRTDYQLAARKWRAFADAAPAEIRLAVEIVAARYALLADTFADIGYDPNGGAEPTAAQAARINEINTPSATQDFKTANDRVTRWLETCGEDG